MTSQVDSQSTQNGFVSLTHSTIILKVKKISYFLMHIQQLLCDHQNQDHSVMFYQANKMK